MTDLQDFARDTQTDALRPLWDVAQTIQPRSPLEFRAHLWKRDVVERQMLRATEVVPPGSPDGTRRALLLESPDLREAGPARTTPTILGAVQIICPGEVAPSHRHSATALRFVMRGSGALTTVNGEPMEMEPGDIVLTPAYSWHDHRLQGAEPVIWLDVNDLPLIGAINGSFFEIDPVQATQAVTKPLNFSARRYSAGMLKPLSTSTNGVSPLLAYRWSHTDAALRELVTLDIDDHDAATVECLNPSTGSPADHRIGAWMSRLPVGFTGGAHRHTYNHIYYVHRGSGRTTCGSDAIEWQQGDLFTVPSWRWHNHENTGAVEADLFSANDRPMLQTLGLLREESLPLVPR